MRSEQRLAKMSGKGDFRNPLNKLRQTLKSSSIMSSRGRVEIEGGKGEKERGKRQWRVNVLKMPDAVREKV